MTTVYETSDNRGRGVFLSRNYSSGEEIIREEAKVLWLSKLYCESECGYCVKHFDVQSDLDTKPCSILGCESCSRVYYCSNECKVLDQQEHTWICTYLQALYSNDYYSINNWIDEEDSCLQLCLKVLYLMHFHTNEYTQVMSLTGESITLSEEETSICHKIYQFVQSKASSNSISSLSIEWVFDLYKKDKSCGFAIMQPPDVRFEYMKKSKVEEEDIQKSSSRSASSNSNSNSSSISNSGGSNSNAVNENVQATNNKDDESTVRGYGVFSYLGIINHSCMPNCVRWDHFDNEDNDNDGDDKSVSSTPYVANSSSSSSSSNSSTNNTIFQFNSLSDTTNDLLSSSTVFSPTLIAEKHKRRSIFFRALFPLAPHTELLQSYVPISWDYKERQEYLLDMFGFQCTCIRCITEAKFEEENDGDDWEDCDDDADDDATPKDVINQKSNDKIKAKPSIMNSSSSSSSSSSNSSIYNSRDYGVVTEEDEMMYNYIDMFLARHICPRNEYCSGVLTPCCNNTTSHTNGMSDNNSDDDDISYECNVCGYSRSHSEFLQSIQEEQEENEREED